MMKFIKNYFQKKSIINLRVGKVNRHLTELESNKWNISNFIYNKIIPIVGFDPYPIDELYLMISSVIVLEPSHIFEWGTHLGRSGRVFYETISYFNIKCEVHSFDLPDSVSHVEHPSYLRAKYIKINTVNLYQEDGLKKSIELFNFSKIENKRPLFYLDGDHSFTTVSNELDCINKNFDDPIILLHDTFYQSSKSQYNIGPYEALQLFLRSNNDFKIINTNFGLPGMSLIFKDKTQ